VRGFQITLSAMLTGAASAEDSLIPGILVSRSYPEPEQRQQLVRTSHQVHHHPQLFC
jgi:hypothetical protein